MLNKLYLSAMTCVLAGAAAAAEPVKIGFITTLSTPAGYIGEDLRDGFLLAVKQGGGKLGGIPVELVVEDDGLKPANAKQAAARLVQSGGRPYPPPNISNLLPAPPPRPPPPGGPAASRPTGWASSVGWRLRRTIRRGAMQAPASSAPSRANCSQRSTPSSTSPISRWRSPASGRWHRMRSINSNREGRASTSPSSTATPAWASPSLW